MTILLHVWLLLGYNPSTNLGVFVPKAYSSESACKQEAQERKKIFSEYRFYCQMVPLDGESE